MAHINSIGAGMFSDMSICVDDTEGATAIANPTEPNLKLCFANAVDPGASATAVTGAFRRITDVREFPSMGTPPNIVNVPVYGQATSQQIQGQADSPSIELTVNYIGTDWADEANQLGQLVGDGNQYVFRFTLMNSEPTATDATKYASTAGGVGTVQNSQYYWIGKIEAIQVNPQLTDANTATITISVQSDFFGAYTS